MRVGQGPGCFETFSKQCGRRLLSGVCATHLRLVARMSLHTHLLRTDRKPSTAPALMLESDTFCSLLLDQPGQSVKLGTLSFVSTPNTLRNTAEAEQSTSLQESACDWCIIKTYHLLLWQYHILMQLLSI